MRYLGNPPENKYVYIYIIYVSVWRLDSHIFMILHKPKLAYTQMHHLK